MGAPGPRKGGGKGKGSRRQVRQNRTDSPDTWRHTDEVSEAPPQKLNSERSPRPTPHKPMRERTTSADEHRIANKNLSLPWMPDSLKPESQSILDALLSADANISTTAWVPMVDLSKDAIAVSTGTYFGSNRCLWKKNEELLPVCLGCKAALSFVCQVDRAALLHPLQGSGIVQVYACARCVQNGALKPRAACWAISIQPDELKDYEVREVAGPQPAGRRVVKWLPRKDYMHPVEAEQLMQRPLSVDEWHVLGEAQIRGDKVGGCVPWLSLNESEKSRLKCKLCDKSLRLLLSLDSADNTAFEWGRDGSLLVFECAFHPDQVVALVVST